MRIPSSIVGCLALFQLVSIAACDDDDEDDRVGTSCTSADQCYLKLDEEVAGAAMCLDRVEGGYCTHECKTDSDCCAVEGECAKDRDQVCAPFESTGLRLCFLSCEGKDEADNFCAIFAHEGFGCRSTGGGSENRKVCVPNG